MNEDIPLSELARRLARAMLPHVPFDGWSPAALATAAHDTGIDPDIAAMALPDVEAMLSAWTQDVNARMAETMAASHNMKVRDRIRMALVTRLEQGDREVTRRALNILAQPQHAALSARLLWQAADAMWRAAGDTATDYNHYTKRLILSGIYSATLLHWTQDDSADFAATRAFIDRRIDGVMRFEKAKAKLTGMAGKLPDPARFLGRLRYPAV
ncbi:COQ9 family protein [Sandarakinorhabdus sp. AAP62]|uniref:COQ9 family protein n=1 Tax=Sandarakinorhabdus sp. AAP62 TaxID=1248916 RepID=UPI00031D22D2|nr:COQ9 family protein [Sandarakinorhabdus sp. AAP62]